MQQESLVHLKAFEFSKRILEKHQWIKDYAEKHFLLIFHLNYTDKDFIPKYLYGFPVWEIRPSEPVMKSGNNG